MSMELRAVSQKQKNPEALGFYRRQNDRLLAGLVAAAYCLAFRKRDPLPGSRVLGSWSATAVLCAFFLSELLLKL